MALFSERVLCENIFKFKRSSMEIWWKPLEVFLGYQFWVNGKGYVGLVLNPKPDSVSISFGLGSVLFWFGFESKTKKEPVR